MDFAEGTPRESMKRSPTTRNRSSRRRARRRRSRDTRASKRASAGTQWSRHGTALPGWGDLSPEKNRRRPERSDGFLERVSTGRFALVVLVLGSLFTMYVGHVHATQDLLARVQEARQVNQSLHLKHNRLKGAYDRATGPAVIHERARELGLRESLTFGPTIELDQ